MAQKVYIVDGRIFRTEADYKYAVQDQETIAALRKESEEFDSRELKKLKDSVHGGKYNFSTLLGQDFEDELADRIKDLEKREAAGERRRDGKERDKSQKTDKSMGMTSPVKKSSLKKTKKIKSAKSVAKSKAAEKPKPQVSEQAVREALKRQEKRRKQVMLACGVGAVFFLGYFGLYIFFSKRTGDNYEELAALKGKDPLQVTQTSTSPVIHYTEDGQQVIPEVLDEYKNLLIKNKKLIGWIKIDDTNIDYPVMQTSDNEYYLDHNINQEYDKNGSIFMDKDCDVLRPSTNLILYGHHMQSGKMFGNLGKYSDKKYYESHRYIQFDTIYEKGVYEVMYVFRSRVYSEQEVVFKYYQFIDALSAVEFDSYMKEMADISLYDTGVTASFGDRLLTLSTCDYQEKNGRFVVVAKKIE